MWIFVFAAVLIFSSGAYAKGDLVPGEYIVKTRSADSSGFRQKLQHEFGKSVEVNPLRTDPEYLVVKIGPRIQSGSAVKVLNQLPEVEFAESNAIVHALAQPNDPDFSVQYALKNAGQADRKGQVGVAGKDINVLPVWASGNTGSKNVLVAVIDSGIDRWHPDLAANVYTNPTEIENGKDDDGNGFVDDIHGWNFFGRTNNPSDGYGHGSHVAGTIGAVGNNGLGMSGVAWNVSLLPVKALDDSGNGMVSDTIEAINYARMMKAKVINISWGTTQYSRALEDAIAKTEAAGILVVIAAGNDGNDNDKTPYYPANLPEKNILSVAAVDNQGKPAEWTNFGKTTVHIAAPGVWIYSTIPGGKYIYAAGTSMAAPHVVGAAALMLAAHPEWGVHELIRRLTASCEPMPELREKVLCGGTLNVAKAINGN